MLLKEFLDLGKTCKVCGNPDPKGVSVRTIWNEEPQHVDVKNDSFVFKVGISEQCHEIFMFSLNEHKAERKIHNPNHLSMMFCNNFIFKITCQKCNSYSFESSLVTYHPLGGLTSNTFLNSEEITLKDEGGWYRIKNMIHTDKIILSYGAETKPEGKIEFPFMTLRDFPIRNKTKMLKKIRTLMLLS